MPATKFICPTGQEVPIEKCLKSCVMGERCRLLRCDGALSASDRIAKLDASYKIIEIKTRGKVYENIGKRQ